MIECDTMPDDNCCYLCNECPKTFATLNELQWHLGKLHDKFRQRNENNDIKNCKTEIKEVNFFKRNF